MAATNDAKKSLEGSEAHTPSKSKNFGKMISSGIRNSSWRESDKKILIFTLPNTLEEICYNHLKSYNRIHHHVYLNCFDSLLN